jgi:L-fuculose-phosphate aldolase
MLTSIGDVMRKCYDNGWITTRDGNVSLRRKDSGNIYITPSGVRKNKIEVESIIKMRMSNGELIFPEGQKPSGELYMHYYLQRFHNETRAVLHVHPTHVVAAIYAGLELDKLAAEFPEISRYTRVAPNIPVLPATSKELADATAGALLVRSFSAAGCGDLQYDIVGQANHGVCAVGKNVWEAYEHVERLDHICQICLLGTASR